MYRTRFVVLVVFLVIPAVPAEELSPRPIGKSRGGFRLLEERDLCHGWSGGIGETRSFSVV